LTTRTRSCGRVVKDAKRSEGEGSGTHKPCDRATNPVGNLSHNPPPRRHPPRRATRQWRRIPPTHDRHLTIAVVDEIAGTRSRTVRFDRICSRLCVVISATLDTSCALNFLMSDEEPDEDLIELVSLALAGRISVKVSGEAFLEVEGTADPDKRARRIARLETFGRLTIPQHLEAEREALADRLHAAIFPNAEPGSRSDDHNQRDCRQLATHKLIGRAVFITRDQRLLRGAETATQEGIDVLSPHDLVVRVESQMSAAGLTSHTDVSVRDADLERDESEIRRVLSPLGDDYPEFDSWLTGALGKKGTRVRVGEDNGCVAAVALSQAKGNGVVKLSAFYVDEATQGAGLGGHLLWSELRTWARHDTSKVYVTVSSRHADLVSFFTDFGFLVEGVSPRRYQADTAELVLGKHFVRERVTDETLASFADGPAGVIFRVPPGAEARPTTWGLPPDTQRPALVWDSMEEHLRLLARDGERELRAWGLLELEQVFYPARFAVSGRRALMVPIEPRWAEALLAHAGQQQRLSQDPASERLLLRADNAYYCYPKVLDIARPGTPILFYVTAPVSSVVGEARIYEAAIDSPEELFAAFGGLGIYRLPQIRAHVIRRGPRVGNALAMRFGMYVPFPQPVTQIQLTQIAKCRRVPQGLLAISFEEFEAVRRTGGLEW
jgi:N-acetylglutamate synthase-like GNAT family acetyltransferase